MTEQMNLKFFIKLVAKCLVALWLVTGFTYGAFSMVEDTLWDMEFHNDIAGMLNRCEEYLIQKDYGRLWDYLELYDLYDSRYDIYWNAVEAHCNEIQYEQWNRAMQDGMDGAKEMVLYYEEQLK